MNFETILFAAAFLLLGILSLSRNETPPVDQAAIGENSNPPAIAAPADDVLLSTEIDTDSETSMIQMPDALNKARLKARRLLQVHDELIFECPKEEAEKTCEIVSKVMVGAPMPAVTLSVSLEVEARAGANWDEAH